MRHTIVVEVPDSVAPDDAERVVTQHVNNVGAYNTHGVRAKVVEYHREQLTIADVTDALASEPIVAAESDYPPHLAGVFWAGDGYEVQRGDEKERFPGDMEAAIHVAKATDCRWLLYVEFSDHPWSVLACSHEDYARGEVEDFAEHYPGAAHAFYFDGRLGLDALEDGPNGVGYRLKGER